MLNINNKTSILYQAYSLETPGFYQSENISNLVHKLSSVTGAYRVTDESSPNSSICLIAIHINIILIYTQTNISPSWFFNIFLQIWCVADRAS